MLLRAREWLEEHCPGRYEAVFSNRFYLEITHRGCNKGGMVARLLEMLHIPRENLYCVGDNQNDIPMMALSAIPFAPANCAQEVKDWGATILCHCDDGVIGAVSGRRPAVALRHVRRGEALLPERPFGRHARDLR